MDIEQEYVELKQLKNAHLTSKTTSHLVNLFDERKLIYLLTVGISFILKKVTEK